MAFRFRRSLRLFPGVRLNFSKSGVSASVGVRGATLNLGQRGARATVGLPGTGLSYTTPLTGQTPVEHGDGGPVPATRGGAGWVLAGLLAAILALVGLSRIGGPSTSATPAATARPAQPLVALTVAPHALNCRAAPAPTARLVRKLPHGTTVSIGERSGDWISVIWAGEPCWALARYLR